MKTALALSTLISGLLLGSTVLANNPYTFITDFELESISVKNSVATITVNHPESADAPRFELINGPSCLLGAPLKCYATVVRLDDPISFRGPRVRTTFEAAVPNIRADQGLELSVNGPNKKVITVKY